MIKRSGDDPRQVMDSAELEAASAVSYPQVARRAAKLDIGMLAIVLAALAVGGVTWMGLTSHAVSPSSQSPSSPVASGKTAALLPAVSSAVMPPPSRALPGVGASVPPSRALPPSAFSSAQPADPRASILIVDNSKPFAVAGAATGGKPAEANAANNALLTSDEQFVSRIAGDAGHATRIVAPAMTVPQGAIVPAVLETALNTDLPGYARAVVSRDVRSFDGSRVLIPRGTRLIGQYKSGLSSGVTRVFVIWTRLIRPDGVSVQLGSPAMDGAGESGLPGEVSTHFWERFGAAMLLSVVSGVSNLGSGSTIVIGSASSAQSVASDALTANTRIPPTVKVAQGAAIQVFVAHDLNFTE